MVRMMRLVAVTALVLICRVGVAPVGTATAPAAADPQVAGDEPFAQFVAVEYAEADTELVLIRGFPKLMVAAPELPEWVSVKAVVGLLPAPRMLCHVQVSVTLVAPFQNAPFQLKAREGWFATFVAKALSPLIEPLASI
jgi:hypothetical protein